MARIAITADFDDGHMLATLGVATTLRRAGHQIVYIGVADSAQAVRDSGFDYIPFLPNVFPTGAANTMRTFSALDQARGEYLEILLRDSVFDGIVSQIQPDLVLMLHYMDIEALVMRFRVRVPVALIRTSCVEQPRRAAVRADLWKSLQTGKYIDLLLSMLSGAGMQVRALDDIVDTLLTFPELITQPIEFELPEYRREPGTHYIGFCVDLDRVDGSFPWDVVDTTRPLITCALGSQSHLRPGTSKRFFQVILSCFAARPHWSAIVAVGRRLPPQDFDVPSNVYLTNWIPQLEVLRRSSVMINQAGLNSVRECILLGVPLIAFPLMYDQFASATRVTRYGLGLSGDIDAVTSDEAGRMIEEVLSDDGIRRRIADMRARLSGTDHVGLAGAAVEAILQQARTGKAVEV